MIRNVDLGNFGLHRRPVGTLAPTQTATPPANAPAKFAEVLKQESVVPDTLQPSLKTAAMLPNGGLMSKPTGNNALTGGTIPYSPNYYATKEAADQLADQLGGTVADLGGQFSNNQAEYYINLPNGIAINAGNLLAVMNNSFFQENSRVMDGKIAELLNNDAIGTPGAAAGRYTVVNGRVTYDPSAQRTTA